jgi:5S rRNA maturation endonuclease (ribonuclease M5)
MRLAGIEIRDFRSIFLDDRGKSLSMELGPGMNTLVGLNNCGKSNVLRAVSLALDPHHPFDPEVDAPGPRQFSLPIITLRFIADGDRAEEQELLAAAADYETGLAGSSSTFASRGEVVLQVAFRQDVDGFHRRELLLSPDDRVPSKTEDEERLAKALVKLRDAVRFVLISSGESIASVLEGNFREILHSVVRERLSREFSEAERSRQEYMSGLQESLLAPLRDRLAVDVGGLFPEINATYLSPEVPSIESTLSNVGVSLEDLVLTPLDQKGTGVRGGVLVAMLSYLALNATRGMVFAVEEPEAFLHPASQEDLRDRLERVAASRDVTLLVTTHSPYLVSRASTGRVFCLAKDTNGRTRVAQSAHGDARHAPLIGDLFRETTLAEMLTQATELPDGAEAVLLVEGPGDEISLRLAARLVGRPDLLEAIHIVPAGNASKVAMEAAIARAATDRPIFVLLDNDQPGREVLKLLTGDKFGFQKGSQVDTYAMAFPANERDFPYEAEDVFDPAIIETFVANHGEAVYDGSRRRPDGAFHYDLNQSAKAVLETHLDTLTQPEHVQRWIELILILRSKLGFPALTETATDIVASAPEHSTRVPSPLAGAALIVANRLDYARYESTGALVLDVDDLLPADLTHVGFYVDGMIQPPIAAVVADYPGLLFSDATAAQLQRTGEPRDGRASKLLVDLIRVDESLADSTHRLLLLSPSDDPETLMLPAPVRNTKEHKDGRPLAWTVGPKLVRAASLSRNPATTDELDELEALANTSTHETKTPEGSA